MTDKTTKRVLVILLLCCGLGLMLFRWLYFEEDRVLNEDTAWKISLAGLFEIQKDISLINSARPKTGKFTRVISQHMYYPGLKLLSTRSGKPGVITARAIRSGTVEFILEYHIQAGMTPVSTNLTDKLSLLPEEREKYLKSDAEVDLTLSSLTNLSEYIRRDVSSRPELLHKIFQHSLKAVKSNERRFDELRNVIQLNKTTSLGRARLMLALCRINDFPTRLVTGFILEESESPSPHYWVEIYDDDKAWLPFDPEKGYESGIPGNYVVVTYENPKLLSIENGKLLSEKYSVSEDLDILNVNRIEQEKSILDVLDLRRLDFETRQTLSKILILPFCVLLAAFFRHVLGFFPYGTFTAPLIALAMVYAEPSITLVVSGIILALALLGRSILPKGCARAPRLSMIFTFVAISMVFSVSLLSYFSIDTGGNIILLPIIILVSLVDRFYSYMDESGPHAALLRLGVTVLIAVFCIPILNFEYIGILILRFPEAHLITASLVLLLASYSGRKLTDNRYLALLGENKPAKKARKKTKPEAEEA